MSKVLMKITADKITEVLLKPSTNPDYPGARFYLDIQEMGESGIRDYVDTYTGGELDCKPLDILTSMVIRRLPMTLKREVW